MYNGKYVYTFYSEFFGYESGGPIGNGSFFTAPINLCKISNGKVVTPLWQRSGERYTGNDTSLDVYVLFLNVGTLSYSTQVNSVQARALQFGSITFTNGKAAISYNDNILK